MRCELCKSEVLKSREYLGNPISIPTLGVVHTICAQLEKCKFCGGSLLDNTEVLGEPIVVKNIGPSHSLCAEKDSSRNVSKRLFGSTTYLKDISLEDLEEIGDLVKLELNIRNDLHGGAELF